MPTYTNNGSSARLIENLSGKTVSVGPGEEIETYKFYDLTDFDLDSDDPLFNPENIVTQVAHIGPAGEEDVPIAIGTKNVKIRAIVTATIAVYLQSSANSPSIAILGPGEVADIPLDSRATNLTLLFSQAGSCQVIASTEEL